LGTERESDGGQELRPRLPEALAEEEDSAQTDPSYGDDPVQMSTLCNRRSRGPMI
jgi:hypothetical protein